MAAEWKISIITSFFKGVLEIDMHILPKNRDRYHMTALLEVVNAMAGSFKSHHGWLAGIVIFDRPQTFEGLPRYTWYEY